MKRVLLLLPEGTEIFEAAAFIDVIGWANTEGDEPISAVSVGLRAEVKCTFGLRLKPDLLLADVDPEQFDALALPGGFEEFGFYEDAYSDPVGELIRAFDRAKKPIAAVCVGALPLARAGVLDGRPATTYHLGDGRRRVQLAEFGAEVIDELRVRDGNVLTSSCPQTAIPVALELLAVLTSPENAARVGELMGFE